MGTKASSIKGLKIFDLSQSKNIGKSQDIVYNPESKKVEAILVSKSGMMSEAAAILINEIKNIGKDAIMVESSQVIKTESVLPPEVTRLINAKESVLQGQVMTESGVILGKISDILFNPSTGMVEEFEISQGTIKDMGSGKKTIKMSDIVSMNRSTVIVKQSVEEQAQKQSQEKGAKGAITKLSSTLKEKTQELKENSSPKTQPPKEPENTVQELKEEGIEIRKNGEKS